MNFFKAKVRKYQEKKLLEAKQKLKFHTETKEKLEKELKKSPNNYSAEVQREIQKQDEFIKIWQKNIDSIKIQLKKLDS